MITYYVSTIGNDDWSGSLTEPNKDKTDGPFASISRAQQAIRELKQKEGLKSPVTVMLREGLYYLDKTIVFTPEDNGTKECPITYQSYPGEKVVLSGGRPIKNWKRHKGDIYQTSLNEQELESISFHQIFYNGKRQILARYPNFDPEHFRTGGFLYVYDEGSKPKEEFFYEEGTIPFSEWGDISQAEVIAVYGEGWNYANSPITDVDEKNCLIKIEKIRREVRMNNHFFIQNVFDALDSPGEWFLDRKTGVLYFCPPDEGTIADDEVVVPVLDDLIVLEGKRYYPKGYLNTSFKGTHSEYPIPDDLPPDDPVRYLNFKGFQMECAQQNAIVLIGAENCNVVGNVIINVGSVGVNLGGVENQYREVSNPRRRPPQGIPSGVGGAGQDLFFRDACANCRVAGNDVYSVGSDGIFLFGTENIAENNHVYDVGLFDKDCGAINMFGERNIVRYNELHDVPRCAVFLKGEDNIVEYNSIHHTVLETPDYGAIRMCQRNLNLHGNIIRFNRILDTLGYGFPRGTDTYFSSYYSWGVYLDDFTAGTTIYGNIIARTGRGGIHIHGGGENLTENNIIVDSPYHIEINPIRDTKVSDNKIFRNIFYLQQEKDDTRKLPSMYDDRPLLYRCGKWYDDLISADHNLIWQKDSPIKIKGKDYKNWEEWQSAGFDSNSVIADPLFNDPEKGNYSLKKDSPAFKLGFKKIPEEKIGCYESPERASWLLVNVSLPQEEPFLYKSAPRPIADDFESTPLGSKPKGADVATSGKSSVTVTDETAVSGKHSLKFVDAPGTRFTWEPRIYYGVNFREGIMKFSCNLRIDEKLSPNLVMEMRQYSEISDREYITGPMLSINPNGELVVNGNFITQIPFDEWFGVEVLFELGKDAPKTYELRLDISGEEPRKFELSYAHQGFSYLERLLFTSHTTERAVFYVDDIKLEQVKSR